MLLIFCIHWLSWNSPENEKPVSTTYKGGYKSPKFKLRRRNRRILLTKEEVVETAKWALAKVTITERWCW